MTYICYLTLLNDKVSISIFSNRFDAYAFGRMKVNRGEAKFFKILSKALDNGRKSWYN